MKALARVLVFSVVLAIPSSQGAYSASINLGGIRLQLPSISASPSERSRTYRDPSVHSHQNWFVSEQGAKRFATNGQGIWVGYDDRGNMAIQVELPVASDKQKGAEVPVSLEVNGRYLETLAGVFASPNLVVIHSADAERVLSRLMSGSRVAVSVDNNRMETHLRGSSRAIGEVRSHASIQKRLFAEGKVLITESDTDQGTDEDAIQFYLPGVPNTGEVEVRFDIVQGTGLLLYLNFGRIEGIGDPPHSIPLTVSETKRVISAISKAEEWTQVAQANRVGLFSKRIGFVDDANGDPADLSEAADDAGTVGAVTGNDAGQTVPEQAEGRPDEQNADPQDFKAITFNSYEDGSTGIQFENSVKGFSRRFNLALDEALELKDSLAATLEYATLRLENRETDVEEKSKLFK